ncbi:MAG: hypothetical protein U1E78_11030 [Gammaproteobacteria bacterium]
MAGDATIKFPWWYTPVKWGIPLALAIGSATLLGMVLAGSIVVPPSLGTLQWLPVLYKSLEGLASFAVMAISGFATASMVGLTVATFVRAWILFPIAESRANLAHFAVVNEEASKQAYSDLRTRYEGLAQAFAQTLWQVTGTFNQHLGYSHAPAGQAATGLAQQFANRYVAGSNQPSEPPPNSTGLPTPRNNA